MRRKLDKYFEIIAAKSAATSENESPGPPYSLSSRTAKVDTADQNRLPSNRAVALKAIEFLPDTDLDCLNFPLGTIMQALKSLVARN